MIVDRPCCWLSLAYTVLILITVIVISLELLEFNDFIDSRAYLIRDDPIVMNRDRYDLIIEEYSATVEEEEADNCLGHHFRTSSDRCSSD